MTSTREPSVVLNPAVRVLWRSSDSVSLELGPDAVVLDGVDREFVHGLLHGTASATVPAELLDTGFLWRHDVENSPEEPATDDRLASPSPRLAGELLALAARHGEQAAELLAARRWSYVAVSGAGRAGALVAAALAAAGVGRVRCTDDGVARLHHALPGGLAPRDEGRPLPAATESAILRAAPGTETTAPSPGERPDLVVLAVDEPLDEQRRRTLHADGTAHLQVAVAPGRGSVGPLVLPGLTSCLRCADLHRRDRDPQWPLLAAQLCVPPRPEHAGDVATALSVAAAAVVQVLAFLDGEHPDTVDGSLELQLPDRRLRRRSRPPHVDCDCTRLGTMAG